MLQALFEEQQRIGYDELFNKMDFLAIQEGTIFQNVIHQRILAGYHSLNGKSDVIRKSSIDSHNNDNYLSFEYISCGELEQR